MQVVVVRERWALPAKGQVCLRLQVVSLGLGREVPQGTGLYWKPWVAGQSPPPVPGRVWPIAVQTPQVRGHCACRVNSGLCRPPARPTVLGELFRTGLSPLAQQPLHLLWGAPRISDLGRLGLPPRPEVGGLQAAAEPAIPSLDTRGR